MKRHFKTAVLLTSVFLAVTGTVIHTQAASGEWRQSEDGKFWYEYSDGTYAKNGWVSIGDNWYYFNAEGYARIGWISLGSNWYYTDASGAMQTGVQEIDGETYLFAESGEMLTSWQKTGGAWHFFRTSDENGPIGSMMKDNPYEQGIVKYGIDVSKYQADIDWQQVKDFGIEFTIIRIGHGERTLDTKFQQNMTRVNQLGIPAGVYFYSTAKDPAQAVLDAQWVIDNLNGYTISYPVVIDMEDSSQSSVLTKAQITGIATAYCDEIRKAGYTPMIYCNENWAKNYLDLDAATGVKRWIARYNYKYDPDYPRDIWQCSSKGRIAGIQGNVDIDFAYTDFTQLITPRTGAAASYVKSIGVWRYDNGGTWYQYLAGGYPKNEWAQIDGKWYWFDAKGYVGTTSGWYELGGEWYYYNTNGTPASGWVAAGSKWYYFDQNGKMTTGWVNDNETWYYMDSEGDMTTGWRNINGTWYYFYSNGKMGTGWLKSGQNWYYLGESWQGAVQTGWQQINGQWYYFDTTGDGRMLYGWQKIDDRWYYFGSSAADGVMKTGWIKSSGKWYYLGENGDGTVQTGWQQINGQWYYFDTTGDGRMLYGWQKINDRWYYFGNSSADGVMKTGWIKNNGKWYYMGENGDGAMKTGWQVVDGTWYYFNPSGAMAVNTWIGNDYVGASGAWGR